MYCPWAVLYCIGTAPTVQRRLNAGPVLAHRVPLLGVSEALPVLTFFKRLQRSTHWWLGKKRRKCAGMYLIHVLAVCKLTSLAAQTAVVWRVSVAYRVLDPTKVQCSKKRVASSGTWPSCFKLFAAAAAAAATPFFRQIHSLHLANFNAFSRQVVVRTVLFIHYLLSIFMLLVNISPQIVLIPFFLIQWAGAANCLLPAACHLLQLACYRLLPAKKKKVFLTRRAYPPLIHPFDRLLGSPPLFSSLSSLVPTKRVQAACPFRRSSDNFRGLQL